MVSESTIVPAAQIRRSIRAALVGVVPALGFYVAFRRAGSGWGVGLGAALTLAVFPIERRLTGRNRWAWTSLIGVAVGSTLVLVTRNPKLFYLRGVIGDGAWGLAMLGSLIVGRPLIGVFARWMVPIPEAYVQTREYRWSFGLVTFVWGTVQLSRAGLRAYLIAHGSLGRFVVVQIATGLPVFLLLLAFAIWYPRRVARRYLVSLGVPAEEADRVVRGQSLEQQTTGQP